jgi:serine/threonine protein kinase
MRYTLALEYAAHGDLGGCLARLPEPWSEAAIRREIAGVLQVLGRLHRGQVLHRDLTPMNVFVCEGHRLKLGDFGITRQAMDGRGITARTLNTITAPSDIIAGTVPKWQARDDVYQVGQLLGMLVRGSASARIGAKDVRRLDCTDHLKEVIYRCLGERRKRFESADELIEALKRKPDDLASRRRRTLQGVHLAFTGILTLPRRDAIAAATRAGAIVHGGPSAKTSVVVRGRPNPLQAAGRDGGVKLLEVKRLRDKGHRIDVLTEAQFWRLTGHPTARQTPARAPSRRP